MFHLLQKSFLLFFFIAVASNQPLTNIIKLSRYLLTQNVNLLQILFNFFLNINKYWWKSLRHLYFLKRIFNLLSWWYSLSLLTTATTFFWRRFCWTWKQRKFVIVLIILWLFGQWWFHQNLLSRLESNKN